MALMPPRHRHYLAAFLLDFAFSSVLTVIPFYIFDRLGGGAGMSGLIAGVYSATYTLACIVSAGFVLRARDGLSFARAGAAGFALFLLLAPWIQHALVFAVLIVTGRTFLALFWPAMQSWLGAEPDPRERARRMAYYNIAWSAGLAIGPLIAGPLYGVHHAVPFVLASGAAMAGYACAASLPREIPRHLAESGTGNPDSAPDMDARANIHLYYAWTANLTGWILIGVVRAIFQKRIDELAALGELQFLWEAPHPLSYEAATIYGWLAMVLYTARTGVSWAMGYVRSWEYRFWVLALLQFTAAGAFYILGVTHSVAMMALCCAVVGINGAASFFASMAYSIAHPIRKHQRAAVHESMTGAGSLIGSVAFGLLAERYSTQWPFLHTPEWVVALVGLQFGLYRIGVYMHRNSST